MQSSVPILSKLIESNKDRGCRYPHSSMICLKEKQCKQERKGERGS